MAHKAKVYRHTIDKLKVISQTLVLAYQNENDHQLIGGGITDP